MAGMARKVRYWIATIYYLWCSVAFVYLIGWVVYQVATGRERRWMLFCVPIYALLSWSFYKAFTALLKKARDQNRPMDSN